MGQVLTKIERFGDFCEGWVPFLLEIKQKARWLVGMQVGGTAGTVQKGAWIPSYKMV